MKLIFWILYKKKKYDICKKLPRYTFCDAILWMKNAARNKQISSAHGWVNGPGSRSGTLFSLERDKAKIVFRVRQKMSNEVTFWIKFIKGSNFQ